ncbi:hypothetical protein Tco_0333788, partial [Tanacetum coccineum]
MSARIAEAADVSPSSFRKRYRSSYETPSPSAYPTLPIRKRYRGTSKLVEDNKEESSDSDAEREGSEDEGPSSDDEGHSLEDEGLGLKKEEEEAAPEGQQQAVLVVDTVIDKPLGLRYGALIRRELALGEGLMPNTFEVGQNSRSASEDEGAERISTFRQPALVTWVNPDDGKVYTNISTYVPPA